MAFFFRCRYCSRKALVVTLVVHVKPVSLSLFSSSRFTMTFDRLLVCVNDVVQANVL